MDDISQLATQFNSSSDKDKLKLVPKLIDSGNSGWEILIEFLKSSSSESPNLVAGKVYQELIAAQTTGTQELVEKYLKNGIVTLKSAADIDYQTLEKLLIQKDFQAADSLTRAKLCELAGSDAIARKWLYFTEVDKIPGTDLQTIDRLWWVYSEGKFGFAVQRKLWLGVGKDFSQLWQKIGWKNDNNWTRYPQEFTWDLNAPTGHLPLLNQLRGVRVITSLFSHPVWSQNL
ncbi:MAG: GUN4 N-terminal ARM-like repeat domain-containing protein [Prochloraceae cyanobacterium]|nr:GUN4 N-terminal ARM-like repeat domain-containing protein [Prochloraceae cyanobacterium]